MFGPPEKHPQHAQVYLDRDGATAIVVSMHYMGRGGVLLQDEEPVVLQSGFDENALGKATLDVLQRSGIRPSRNLVDLKSTDGPAFKSSRCRSVKQFETKFIRLDISGANEMNLIYQIEGEPEAGAKLRVLGTASSANAAEVGETCLAVWRACRDRTL